MKPCLIVREIQICQLKDLVEPAQQRAPVHMQLLCRFGLTALIFQIAVQNVCIAAVAALISFHQEQDRGMDQFHMRLLF